MKLVSVLFTQLIVSCWCGKPIDYTPLLKYLDDDIVRDLIDPIEGRGHVLLENVETYNSRLGDCRDMVQQNVFEAYVKAVELQKIGGPQFLKANVDRELLKKAYNWSDDDLKNLEKHFETTKMVWREVEGEFKSAEAVFKIIQEKEAKERAEQAEQERERVERLRKAEEEFSKKVTVNIGTAQPSP